MKNTVPEMIIKNCGLLYINNISNKFKTIIKDLDSNLFFCQQILGDN